MNGWGIFAIIFACLLFVYLLIVFILLPKKCYFSAIFSGCYVSAFKLMAMKLQKQGYNEVVSAYILSKKSKLPLQFDSLEKILISGGHPTKVVQGLNAAKSANMKLSLDFFKSVDISGKDCLEVVRECINPKVIEIPLITAVARDNVEVNAKVSLTLKIELSRYLSGVNEETISARAVEAVVTKICNTEFASSLTARPELLDKAIFDADIDGDSKFVLMSADVIHISLGEDRTFISEKQLIEREHLISMNKLDEKKRMAEIREQELKAEQEEEKLALIKKQAEVSNAIIQAINDGKIKDVIDIYKLENLQADTEMRKLMAKNYKNNKD